MFARAVASIAAAAPRLGRRGVAATSVSRSAYRAFISYSHAVDGDLAPAVQLALHRFARPWYRLRALRVFRDEASLSATPALWGSIVQALDSSEFFLLFASPEAAQSTWVGHEIEHWCEQGGSSKVFVVLTGGELFWDDDANDFDWSRTTAMPQTARGRFDEEPRWLDLRWTRTSDNLSLRNGRFRDAIADLAAPLHGRPKDELIGEDVRQHRRTIQIAVTAAVVLAVFAVAASTAAVIAFHERSSAIQHSRVARSRELAARAVAQLSVRTPELGRGPSASLTLALAATAATSTPTDEAANVLRRSLAVPHVRFVVQERSDDLGVAFADDGARLIVVGANGTVHLWDTSTGRVVKTVDEAAGPVGTLVLSPDGTRFVTAGRHGDSRLWNAATEAVVAELPGAVSSAPFARGPGLVATTKRGTTRLFDARSGKPRGVIGKGFSATFALFDPTGARLALVGTNRFGANAVGLWDVKSRRLLRMLFEDAAHGELTEAAISPNGRRLAVASLDSIAWVIATDKRAIHALVGHNDVISSVSFSADSARVLTVSADKNAIVWDAATGEVRNVLPLTGMGNRGAFSPDGRLIATAADDALASQLWDTATGTAAAFLGGESSFAEGVAFSRDGRLLACSDDEGRSEERRVGKECRSRWSPYH